MNDDDLMAAVRAELAPVRMTVAADAIMARGRGMRRMQHGRIAASALAVALGAGLGIPALTSAGTPASPGPDGLTALPSAAHITAQLVDALQVSRADVLYDQEVQTMPGSTLSLHEWLSPWDPSSGQTVDERIEYFQHCAGCEDSGLVQDWEQKGTMPAGANASEEFPWGTSVTTTGESIDVRYHYQQWTDQKSAPVSFNLPLTSADIQQEIATANARVVGNATIDGVQTVELAISGFDGPGSSGDIWVDASSHLPVRTVVSAPVRVSGQAAPTSMQTVRDDYQFLPATPANLAKLNPVIPSNFTENPTLDNPASGNGS